MPTFTQEQDKFHQQMVRKMWTDIPLKSKMKILWYVAQQQRSPKDVWRLMRGRT